MIRFKGQASANGFRHTDHHWDTGVGDMPQSYGCQIVGDMPQHAMCGVVRIENVGVSVLIILTYGTNHVGYMVILLQMAA